MKRTLFFLLMMSISIAIVAQSGTKQCPSCMGTGHPFGHSEMTCSRCGGSGRIARSASEMRREARDNERYANSANDLMQQFNLSPQEFFAYEELIKQAMTQVPVYQDCTGCGGTGRCKQCGGVMNVSLDGPLCRICGGSGMCIGCNGLGKLKIGMQENPNKQQLIQRANEILHSHENSPSSSSPGISPSTSLDESSSPTSSYEGEISNGVISEGISSSGQVVSGAPNPTQSSSESSEPPALFLFFMGFCVAGLLTALVILLFRLTRK